MIVLDAGVLIALGDTEDAFHAPARTAVSSAVADNADLVVPASVYAESLVRPYQRDAPDAITAIDTLLTRLAVRIRPLDAELAKRTARLRARHQSLKLPDAMVLATALAAGPGEVLTTDSGWPDVEGVTVTVLRP